MLRTSELTVERRELISASAGHRSTQSTSFQPFNIQYSASNSEITPVSTAPVLSNYLYKSTYLAINTRINLPTMDVFYHTLMDSFMPNIQPKYISSFLHVNIFLISHFDIFFLSQSHIYYFHTIIIYKNIRKVYVNLYNVIFSQYSK